MMAQKTGRTIDVESTRKSVNLTLSGWRVLTSHHTERIANWPSQITILQSVKENLRKKPKKKKNFARSLKVALTPKLKAQKPTVVTTPHQRMTPRPPHSSDIHEKYLEGAMPLLWLQSRRQA